VKQSLYYVAPEQCSDAKDEWHYDVEPTKGTPTKLVACPSTCEHLKTLADAKLHTKLGCVRIVK
jgi:hypothetical protein